MRILSIVFSFILAINVSAQTITVNQLFDEGTQKARTGNYENAIKDYQKAVQFSQNGKMEENFLARLHFNIGVCLFHLKRNSEAVIELTEAINLNKENYQKAFYTLGMAHRELKNWQTAKTAFLKALELRHNDGEAWFDLALVYLQTEDFGEAEKAFQNAVRYKSIGSADAHNNIGVIYALKNNFPAAEKEFKKALIMSNGTSIEAANNLQFCKLYKQNFDRNLLAGLEFSQIQGSKTIN